MSEYQRFISYMYEYRNGKKSTNCGYARVENRNRLCRLEIHMKTSPQALEEPLRIYGCFHRDGRLFGVLLGQHAPVLDMVNWRYQGDPDNLNASQVSLSQLEGLILSDGSQIAYCSMWNDTPIDPNQMTPYVREEPGSADTPSPMAESDTLPEETASRNNMQANGMDVPDIPPVTAADVSAPSPMDTTDTSVVSPMNMADTPDPLPEDPTATTDFPQANTADTPEAVSAAASPSPESCPQADIPDGGASENVFPNENAPANESGNPPVSDPFPADSFGEDSAREQSADRGPADAFLPDTAISDTVNVSSRPSYSREPERNMADTVLAFQQKQAEQTPDLSTSPSPWEQIQATYPQINPFTDDEIQDCVRIELSDLPTLRQNGWRIAGNRFILHSFQKNRHLVLGHLKSNGHYIFAVPGYYDNQERFMANMFGFPYFKPSDGGPLRYGQKGYWYRLLY
ncbi:MAG TPA: hypothetical protein DF613_17280 [Lachnospiraceae bacterium]|nr:hypothetical protein [Lachnospiraceae bacterium]